MNFYNLCIWAAFPSSVPNLFALAFTATKKDFHSSRAADSAFQLKAFYLLTFFLSLSLLLFPDKPTRQSQSQEYYEHEIENVSRVDLSSCEC